jgi:hypothetical protein
MIKNSIWENTNKLLFGHYTVYSAWIFIALDSQSLRNGECYFFEKAIKTISWTENSYF